MLIITEEVDFLLLWPLTKK